MLTTIKNPIYGERLQLILFIFCCKPIYFGPVTGIVDKHYRADAEIGNVYPSIHFKIYAIIFEFYMLSWKLGLQVMLAK